MCIRDRDIASASETPLSRSVKPSLDLPSASGQGRSFKPSLDLTSVQGMPLTTAASLPTSGLKGNFQPSSKTAATSRLESHREAAAHSPPPTLMSQPSQLVQTVQQMLAEMQQGRQARESLGNSGRVSPRTMSVGTLAVTDASPIPEGRARQAVPGVAVRDARILNSPFAEQLASKPTANAISRRCAMGGPSTRLSLLHFLRSVATHSPPTTDPCCQYCQSSHLQSCAYCFRSPRQCGHLSITHSQTLTHACLHCHFICIMFCFSTIHVHLLSLSLFWRRHGH